MTGNPAALTYSRGESTPDRADSATSAQESGHSGAPAPGGSNTDSFLAALCVFARFHQVAADPTALSHQLGLADRDALTVDDLLRAAKELGLKAKRVRTTVARLALTPLPALALMRTDGDGLHVVVLAQCDAKRVLVQDPATTTDGASSRPTIEPIDLFESQWTRCWSTRPPPPWTCWSSVWW